MILLIFHLSTTNWTTFKLNMIYNIRRSAADNLSAISGHFMYSPRSGLARWFAEAAHKAAGEIRSVVEAGCDREFRDRPAFARARQALVRPIQPHALDVFLHRHAQAGAEALAERVGRHAHHRSEEHTSELQSLMLIS